MEGHCSTSQSPQWAVVSMEEEEEEEEESRNISNLCHLSSHVKKGAKFLTK